MDTFILWALALIGLFHIFFAGTVKALSNALYRWKISLWQERGGGFYDPARPRRQSMTHSLGFYRALGLIYLTLVALILYYAR